MPSYQRHPTAQSEDGDGHDQRPEVKFFPWPKGCVKSGGRRLWRRPNKSKVPLPVSTSEWIPLRQHCRTAGDRSGDELGNPATATFPMMAATIATLDSAAPLFEHAMCGVYPNSATWEYIGVALPFVWSEMKSVPPRGSGVVALELKPIERDRNPSPLPRGGLTSLNPTGSTLHS